MSTDGRELNMTKEELLRELELLRKRVTNLEGQRSKNKELQNMVESLFNSSPIGMYIVQEGLFVVVSTEFGKVIGYSDSELIGHSSLTLVLPEDREMVRENAIMELKGETPKGHEFRIVTKTGETRNILETIAPIQYLGKRAVLGNFMDITARKKLEQERELLIQELQESLAKVNTLSGLLPICAWCKKLRDEEGYWESVEEYITELTGAEFTHGMCPSCLEKYSAELSVENNNKQKNSNKVSKS